jgi:hypothetical protein
MAIRAKRREQSAEDREHAFIGRWLAGHSPDDPTASADSRGGPRCDLRAALA